MIISLNALFYGFIFIIYVLVDRSYFSHSTSVLLLIFIFFLKPLVTFNELVQLYLLAF